MNKYRCTPRVGQPMTIYNPSEDGARHVCMRTAYGDARAPAFLNMGVGLDIICLEEDVEPPTKGVHVYPDPKPEKQSNPKIGWR